MRNWFRRKILILFGLCAVFAAGLYAFYPREPSFDGKSLSEWVLVVRNKGPGPEKEKARGVVRQLASNSIPMLLRWLQEPDGPSFHERIYDVNSKVFWWLAARHIIKPRSVEWMREGRSHRTTAFFTLPELDSENKKAVIPVLIRMLGDKHHKPDEVSEIAGIAFIVLRRMAPESVDPLIEALTHQDVQVWVLAEGALGNIGPDAKKAIPTLEKAKG